jgi:hypothetical protein
MLIPTESSRMVRGAGKCISNTFHELFAEDGRNAAMSGGHREPAPVIALVNIVRAVFMEAVGGISSRQGRCCKASVN